jgi:hypothetical protein
MFPEQLLQYDSRIDCLSADYASYSVYFWVMALLWPVGCPLVLLLLLKLYRVPEIAVRKFREAKVRAFVLHSMAKASETGVAWTEAGAESYPNFHEMGLPLLLLLGKVHGIDATSVTVLGTELTARMQELLASEAVVLPLVEWERESPDPEERLALTRLESLIGAYEVRFWWYVRPLCLFA